MGTLCTQQTVQVHELNWKRGREGDGEREGGRERGRKGEGEREIV
jgi:hypothetical protein